MAVATGNPDFSKPVTQQFGPETTAASAQKSTVEMDQFLEEHFGELPQATTDYGFAAQKAPRLLGRACRYGDGCWRPGCRFQHEHPVARAARWAAYWTGLQGISLTPQEKVAEAPAKEASLATEVPDWVEAEKVAAKGAMTKGAIADALATQLEKEKREKERRKKQSAQEARGKGGQTADERATRKEREDPVETERKTGAEKKNDAQKEEPEKKKAAQNEETERENAEKARREKEQKANFSQEILDKVSERMQEEFHETRMHMRSVFDTKLEAVFRLHNVRGSLGAGSVPSSVSVPCVLPRRSPMMAGLAED